MSRVWPASQGLWWGRCTGKERTRGVQIQALSLSPEERGWGWKWVETFFWGNKGSVQGEALWATT